MKETKKSEFWGKRESLKKRRKASSMQKPQIVGINVFWAVVILRCDGLQAYWRRKHWTEVL